jgi:hypothetical protein
MYEELAKRISIFSEADIEIFPIYCVPDNFISQIPNDWIPFLEKKLPVKDVLDHLWKPISNSDEIISGLCRICHEIVLIRSVGKIIQYKLGYIFSLKMPKRISNVSCFVGNPPNKSGNKSIISIFPSER